MADQSGPVGEEDYWMVLWKLQRDEVSTRLQIENHQTRVRKELQGSLGRDLPRTTASNVKGNPPRYAYPAGVESAPQSSNAQNAIPAYEKIEDLRARIGALTETKQILVSEYVRARCPEAITTDESGIATIDPYLLDEPSFDAVMVHLDLIEEDSRNGPVSSQSVPRYTYPQNVTQPRGAENVWNTGYVGDPTMPPRNKGARPNGTMPPGTGGWEDLQPATAASSHWMYQQEAANAGQSPRTTKGLPDSRLAAVPEDALVRSPAGADRRAFSEAELSERKALARKIQSLSDAHQRAVSQEVRMFAPQAIFQPQPGYATINTSELDRRTFQRVKDLVDEMQEVGKEDAARERERLIRRQMERENFIARERARERERGLDMERERRIREMQVAEDLERDLKLVHGEAEKTRNDRRVMDSEQKNAAMMSKMSPRREEEKDVNELRRRLHDTLLELNDHNLLAFADYGYLLQPDVIQNNALEPSNFKPAVLPAAMSYALQLKAEQRRLAGPGASAPPPTQIAPPIEAAPAQSAPIQAAPIQAAPAQSQPVQSQPVQSQPPLVATQPAEAAPTREIAAKSAPPAAGQSAPAPTVSREDLRLREEISQRIYHLPHSKQKAVCSWLRENSPEAITTQAHSTSIDTQFMTPDNFAKLKGFVTEAEASK